MPSTVVLKKTREANPTNLSGRYLPASYDVYVNGIKVGSLEGRSPGRGANRPFHELRDLKGKAITGSVGVRGRDRARLDALAIDLHEVISRKP